MRDRIHDRRQSSDRDDKAVRRRSTSRRLAIIRCGRQDPAAATKEIGARGLQASGSRARERMPADESQPRRQMTRGLDHRALGTPDVGDDRAPTNARSKFADNTDVLAYGRRQND